MATLHSHTADKFLCPGAYISAVSCAHNSSAAYQHALAQISNAKLKTTEHGIIILVFDTVDKYYQIEHSGSAFNVEGQPNAECFTLAPIDCANRQHDYEIEISINLPVGSETTYISSITALKYSYNIALIPAELIIF